METIKPHLYKSKSFLTNDVLQANRPYISTKLEVVNDSVEMIVEGKHT